MLNLFCRLALFCALPLLAACTQPETQLGFDPEALAKVPGAEIEGWLRVPPGSDLNGPAYLVLKDDTETPQSEDFEMELQGNAFETPVGSTGLRFSLNPADYGRYDRTRRAMVARLNAGETVTIAVRYRLCRRAGVTVSPPFAVGFLLTGSSGTPIYLADFPVPKDVVRSQIPFCI